MWWLLKKILFLIPAEVAHHLACISLKLFSPLISFFLPPKISGQKTSFHWKKLTFPNRVGLAAGFDKNAEYLLELEKLGFGFIEIGTVTPKPQEGNPKPRLFRDPENESIINRMGFNNQGMKAVANNLIYYQNHRPKNSKTVIGINIGKNKVTPNEKASEDYLQCLETLFPHGDYFVVNISSPNTPGLRDLFAPEKLKPLLQQITQKNITLGSKPLLLKISPDITRDELHEILAVALECEMDGFIVSNTTIDHQFPEQGGMSGAPLFENSSELLAATKEYLTKSPNDKGKELILIGVGGINSTSRARQKIEKGADLIQIYSGLIYNGPGFPNLINRELYDLEN